MGRAQGRAYPGLIPRRPCFGPWIADKRQCKANRHSSGLLNVDAEYAEWPFHGKHAWLPLAGMGGKGPPVLSELCHPMHYRNASKNN